jgi:hypothetical protein
MIPDALFAQARRKALQILRLRLADDLHAPRLDVLVVPGEGQAGLLYARPEDGSIEPVVSRDDFQGKLIELADEQRPNRGLDEVLGGLCAHLLLIDA